MKIKANKIQEYLFFLLLIINLIDVKSKIFKINIPIIISSCLIYLIQKKNKKYLGFICTYLFIFILYGAIIGLINKNEKLIEKLIYIFKVTSPLLFLLTLKDYSLNKIENLIRMSGKIYLYFLSIIYLIFMCFNGSYLTKFILHNLEISLEIRKYFGINFIFFYISSSVFLVFIEAYFLFVSKKNKIYAFLALFFLIISKTTANFLSGILILGYFCYNFIAEKLRIKSSLRIKIAILIFILGIAFLYDYIFDYSDIGDSIKKIDFFNYIKFWKSNYEKFIIGEGIGGLFYSELRNAYLLTTELTYLELIRQYGIILMSIILYFLWKFSIFLFKNKETIWFGISWLSYLFIIGTNPYFPSILFTQIFILVVILYYDMKRVKL